MQIDCDLGHTDRIGLTGKKTRDWYFICGILEWYVIERGFLIR